MIKVAILGVAGYAAKELIELLLSHPEAEIISLVSESINQGTDIADIWPRFRNQLSKTTTAEVDETCDVAIISKPQDRAAGETKKLIKKGIRVIDLSAAYRLRLNLYEATYGKHQYPELIEEAVYGLSELYRDDIHDAQLVANPGCYPTSAILGAAPLLKNRLIEPRDIIIEPRAGGEIEAANIPRLSRSVRLEDPPSPTPTKEVSNGSEAEVAKGSPIREGLLCKTEATGEGLVAGVCCRFRCLPPLPTLPQLPCPQGGYGCDGGGGETGGAPYRSSKPTKSGTLQPTPTKEATECSRSGLRYPSTRDEVRRYAQTLPQQSTD